MSRKGIAAAALGAAAGIGLGMWLAASTGGGDHGDHGHGAGDSADHEISDHAAAPSELNDETELELVVLVVIDQLPSWTFERDRRHLDGGIARLLREGAYFPEAAFPYANTYTAPGHTALGTGAPPAVSGILANDWYHRELGESLAATDDADAPIFAIGDGEAAAGGASPQRLEVTGVADALREVTNGEGRSIAIGIKARSAIFTVGRRPDLAVFYDADQAAMTTSAYYVDEAPQWLVDLHEENPVAARLDDVWEPSDPELLADVTGRADDGPGEGALPGHFDSAFPHELGETLKPATEIQRTPSAVSLTADTARAAIAGEDLGGGGAVDLLAVSFSSPDYAGHFWGQESWERLDVLLRIDQALGELFSELDDAVGPEGYAVVLSSDHGAAPLVEAGAIDRARRVSPAEVAGAANGAIASILGDGDYVQIRSASTLFLRGLDEVSEGDRDRALDAAVAAVRELDGIGYAARTDRLRGDCDAMEGDDALACRSTGEGMGEIIHFPAEGSLITNFPTGTTHGSPHDYDRVVPLIVRAPGWTPGTRPERVSILRVAPTLAALLGGELPAHALPPLDPD